MKRRLGLVCALIFFCGVEASYRRNVSGSAIMPGILTDRMPDAHQPMLSWPLYRAGTRICGAAPAPDGYFYTAAHCMTQPGPYEVADIPVERFSTDLARDLAHLVTRETHGIPVTFAVSEHTHGWQLDMGGDPSTALPAMRNDRAGTVRAPLARRLIRANKGEAHELVLDKRRITVCGGDESDRMVRPGDSGSGWFTSGGKLLAITEAVETIPWVDPACGDRISMMLRLVP